MQIKVVALGDYQANCYLIADEEAKVCGLVDPGDQADVVEKMLANSGCQLTAIMLTHGHLDHMGAVDALVANHPGVTVYRHDGDEPSANAPGLFPQMSSAVTAVAEGDTIQLGGSTITVLHTPGHSKGSVTYEMPGYLFTGDTLFQGSMGRTDFPGGSEVEIMASLTRLAKLPGDYSVLSGHMGTSTLDQERKTNYFMKQAMGG